MRPCFFLFFTTLFLLCGCSGKGHLLGRGNHPEVRVSIFPASVALSVGATQRFTARITGTPNQEVLWSVQEGATGGTITGEGLYTAPGTPGIYHVIATNPLAPGQSAVATVTVEAALLPVVVN